jgi:predicted nucleic acid-binding Zn ribbon protein
VTGDVPDEPVEEPERWRPRPGRRLSRPRVPGETRQPTEIGDALSAVGRELGLADPRAVTALTSGWADVVGEMVAAHARLRSLRGGVLTIEVDAAPWATQLRYLTDTLSERVAALVGSDVVREIRVVVAPGGP